MVLFLLIRRPHFFSTVIPSIEIAYCRIVFYTSSKTIFTTMDQMPFDVLHHMCGYLSLLDLRTFGALGPLHEEAAERVASRRHECTLNVAEHPSYEHLRDFCQYLTSKPLRKLTVKFIPQSDCREILAPEHPACNRYACIVLNLITAAKQLVDLTIVNKMCDNDEIIRLKPGISLSGIQRLTLYQTSDDDDFIGQLLSVCDAGLAELTMENMLVEGICFEFLEFQLSKLSFRKLHHLNAMWVKKMLVKFPRLQTIEHFDPDSREGFCYMPQLVKLLHHVQELRLRTDGHTELLGLQDMVGMRIMHVTLTWGDAFPYILWYIGPDHQLRQLGLTVRKYQLTVEMGYQMRQWTRLESLHVDALHHVVGLDDLMHGFIHRQALASMRDLKLTSRDGRVFVSPTVLFERMPLLESLHMRALLTEDLTMLAQMDHLRTLELCLVGATDNTDGDVQLAQSNRFVRDVAAAGRLTTLHLRSHHGGDAFTLEAATLEALRGFSSLAELKLVASQPDDFDHCGFESVAPNRGYAPRY